MRKINSCKQPCISNANFAPPRPFFKYHLHLFVFTYFQFIFLLVIITSFIMFISDTWLTHCNITSIVTCLIYFLLARCFGVPFLNAIPLNVHLFAQLSCVNNYNYCSDILYIYLASPCWNCTRFDVFRKLLRLYSMLI